MDEDANRSTPALEVHLNGFDGPLYLLLDLARRQQVNLAQISVTKLVDQYVAAITGIDKVDVGRAVEWLVMAAWLTWLKSRLLLPKTLTETKEAERAAQVLTDRLTVLDRVRAVGDWLDAQPQLGRDTFERGGSERVASPVSMDYLALFEACLSVLKGQQDRAQEQYRPIPPRALWTTGHAFNHMRRLLDEKPEGGDFFSFLPGFPAAMPDREFHIRSAVASTLIASLELAREGLTEIRQEESFGPISIRSLYIGKYLDL